MSADPIEFGTVADPDDVRTTLEQGSMEILGRIRTASNATLVCELAHRDTRLRAVYKPVRGEVPLWDFPTGTLAGREVSSYEISSALGWDAIPTTVLRGGDLGPGMVQRWVDTVDVDPASATPGQPRLDLVDVVPPEMIPAGWKPILEATDGAGDEVILVHADDPRLLRLAVLDVLINNADRKGGHVLESVDGGVYGVDHGICLHQENKLRTVLWGWAGEPVPPHLLGDVETLLSGLTSPASGLRTRLSELISAEEIAALIARARSLIAARVMPTPDRGRPIPWPVF